MRRRWPRPFLARFPAEKNAGCTNASHDLYHTPPPYRLTPDSLSSPAKSVRAYATSEPNFLGWIVYQIVLPMVLRCKFESSAIDKSKLNLFLFYHHLDEY